MRDSRWPRARIGGWLRGPVGSLRRAAHVLGRAGAGPAVLPDLRTAVHSLRRAPGFTLVAVITLGFGVGANTSMFGVLNAILLRPAPYRDSGQLDRIYRATPENPRGGVAPADYLDLEPETGGYAHVAAYGYSDVSLSEPGRPAETAAGLRISANLLATLGARPRLGRTFRANEDLAGNHRVLILSHRYWQERFGGEDHVIGRGVRLGGALHEIVGVLPADFSDWRHLEGIDVYQPLGLTGEEIRDRSSTWLNLIGRRSVGTSRAQARAAIADFGGRLAAQYPALHAGSAWRTVSLDQTVVAENRQHLLGMLVALSGFVLLIACSNLANLVLARTAARARELALRSALGASRAQTLRPLLLESLLLATGGGVCAVFVALWTFRWFTAQGGFVLAFDWRVLSWTLGASLLTVVAFAAAPALFVQRLDPNRTLQRGTRGATADPGYRGFRQLLVVGQFALAMVLLAGAALFLRGLDELRGRRSGFVSDRLVTGNVVLPSATYPGAAEIAAFQGRALERLAALPGVESVSLSDSMPFLGQGEIRNVLVAGRDTPGAGQQAAVRVNGVSAQYFQTVGTLVLSGRRFDEGDTPTSPKVFIVSQAMARGLFGGESPLGRRLAEVGGGASEWGEIVGVAADVQPVTPDPSPLGHQLYRPVTQAPRRGCEIAVRAAAVGPASSALVDQIRATIMSLDAELPVRNLQAAEITIGRATRQWDVLGSILRSLAVLGLGLASLGLYGVVSRTVALRRSEFGIRLALGARPGDIVRLVLVFGGKLALVGSTVGLLGALGVSRLLAALLPGMQTNTLPVLSGITILLVAVALVACHTPALSAANASISETLRAE